jgi:hypothetical protein
MVARDGRDYRATSYGVRCSAPTPRVTGTKVWLQEGPGGPVEILVMETADPVRTFADIGASQEPFDLWFRALILEVCGLDLSQPPPGPPPRQILDWSARALL